MEDLDQLLVDLKQAHSLSSLSNGSSLSSASSLSSYNLPSFSSKVNTTLNVNHNFKREMNVEKDRFNAEMSQTCRIGDLNELDNLLDDLRRAKEKLTKNLSLKDEIKTKEQTTNQIENSSSASSLVLQTQSESTDSYSSRDVSSKLFDTNFQFGESTDTKRYTNFLNTSDETNRFQISSENVSLTKENAEKELEDMMTTLTIPKKCDDNKQNIDQAAIEYDTDSVNSKPRNHSISKEKICAGCNEPINGKIINAMGLYWHPNHFVCNFCHEAIGTCVFYEKDNKPFCENDYLQMFSPKCADCSKPILDKMLTALNKSWHISCFKCSSCSKSLNNECFLEMNNHAFCKDCYSNKLAPKCKRCTNSIIDNYISALDSYWHPNCFVCQDCGLAFNSSNFYEFDGLPYCEIHYHMKRGSICHSCQQPINGRCVTAMNKRFHPQHFTCSFCLKELNKGTFKEKNEKPYCQMCFLKLFPF